MVIGRWIVDFLIIGWLLLAGFDGYKKGLLKGSLELIGLALGVVAGLIGFSYPSKIFRNFLGITPGVSNLFSFTLIFLTALLIFFILFDPVFVFASKVHENFKMKKWFHAGGIMPELIKNIIVLSIISASLAFFPINKEIQNSVKQSYLGAKLADSTGVVEPQLEQVFGKAIEEGMLFSVAFVKSRTEHPFSPGRPPDKILKFDPEAENKMLKLLNIERAKMGLGLLQANSKLRIMAREHSLEMFKKNYFSHTSPFKGSFANRLSANKIGFFIAGENLALAPDVYVSHRGLMNSKHHRENILNPQFKKVGIGIVDAGIYEQMYTQEFTD